MVLEARVYASRDAATISSPCSGPCTRSGPHTAAVQLVVEQGVLPPALVRVGFWLTDTATCAGAHASTPAPTGPCTGPPTASGRAYR